ncbi:unnamed protein product [Vitrella brassicaformis CCMP3155]|uniref:Reverse transcriptase domain-containing protein n=1 Tax=Vitrella brassicaformis (strain CCMP3155) TaxID=1169540 RepID=A0A0G4FT13_VITBC|nr:unnamed protein product [Vitrella brassicaformis CCMP3155]|eukprot:CEM17622.1 unnamed protein product [Vitrella brassicaformis CCMP3155]
MASRIANEDVPWEQLQALRACRLIGLDKQPGVRPIGIEEVLMRIMGKAMAKAVGVDAEIVCGADQLCAGLKGGVEGAIHAVSGPFDSGGVECALLPWCSRFLFNTYRGHAALYMRDQSAPLWSREGTTQGDPLASLFYSVATLPLVWEMKRPAEEGPQAWFADDSAKVGDLQPVRDWWDELQRRGPLRGYHPNGKKSKLVVRAGCEERAQEVFGDTDVEIVSGARYMGGFVGTAEGKRAYATERVQE